MHITTKIIIVENILLFTFPVVLWLTGFEQPLSYQWHKLLHILGVTLFLGNIIITGAWMFFATKSQNRQIIHFAAKITNWMDVIFTGPGAILLFMNGLWLSTNWGAPPLGFLTTGWLFCALVLFVLSGVIWFYLIYLQERFIQTTSHEYENLDSFNHAVIRWYIYGTIAVVLPLISMSLMILKPGIAI